MRSDLEPWTSEPDLRERTGNRRKTKGRSWEIQTMRDWTGCNISSSKLQQAAIQKKKKKEAKKAKKKKPSTVSICFGGWKAGGEIKQAFDISVMYKRNQTLGRIRRWTSSPYIHCLSYALCQCIHTPPWNQSQNTLCRLLFPLHMDTKPLCFGCIVSVCACQKNYSILFLWQGFPGCHKPLKAATSGLTQCRLNYFCVHLLPFFCLCVGSLARLLFHVGKRHQESIYWWRGMAAELT